MTVTLTDLETTAATILEGVINHEAQINTLAASTGILPAVLLAEKALPGFALALRFAAQETGKPLSEIFGDALRHIIPGLPNFPVFGPAVTVDPVNPVGE